MPTKFGSFQGVVYPVESEKRSFITLDNGLKSYNLHLFDDPTFPVVRISFFLPKVTGYLRDSFYVEGPLCPFTPREHRDSLDCIKINRNPRDLLKSIGDSVVVRDLKIEVVKLSEYKVVKIGNVYNVKLVSKPNPVIPVL